MDDLYASIGAEMRHFLLDPENAQMTPLDSLDMPGAVQYGWSHPHLPIIYLACAERTPGREHYTLCAVQRSAGGSLAHYGSPASLPARPIHVTVHPQGTHALVLYNNPPSISVHEVGSDGSLGDTVPPRDGVRIGPYPHQVRVTPCGEYVIAVARGNAAERGRAADLGELNVLSFDNGRLTNRADIELGGHPEVGTFQPRHMVFHPDLPLVYVTLEAQNKLLVLDYEAGRLGSEPRAVEDLLVDSDNVRPRQMAGAIHLHPNGRYIYVANRADGSVDTADGAPAGPKWEVPAVPPVSIGGENTITVFELDSGTGQPKRVDVADTRGFCPRTFSIAPNGTNLVVANMKPMRVRDGDAFITIPASLGAFTIRDDGSLAFAGKYDIDSARYTMEWMTILPGR